MYKVAGGRCYSIRFDDYIKNAYEFVRDEISHSWDVNANLVSKNASEVLINKTGICWTKFCLLAALLRGNRIPSGISYQKLTRADDASDGYIIHALNTVYILLCTLLVSH